MNVDASKGGQKYLPIYEHPYWWAKRFGELDQFHASHTLNVACATAIDLTLAKHYDFDTGHPDIAPAAKEIVDKFGFDRTIMCLPALFGTMRGMITFPLAVRSGRVPFPVMTSRM